ncbi:MAG: hypothetical protein GY862_04525 [Gammaproteobacteria bacterium]|nr:hypothetical protein [Gammaproteobacteria bacterium]
MRSIKPPGHIEAVTGGPVMPILHDNGIDGDQQAGDRIYSGVWIPDAIGKRTLEYIFRWLKK